MRYPDNTQRHAILGRTGSGKTQAAVFFLSFRDYDAMPWVVYNFKEDELINGIPHARHIGVDEVPIRPGVYVVHPHPDEQEEVEAQMWRVWARENTGVYVDE